jgi:hypothetical protein
MKAHIMHKFGPWQSWHWVHMMWQFTLLALNPKISISHALMLCFSHDFAWFYPSHTTISLVFVTYEDPLNFNLFRLHPTENTFIFLPKCLNQGTKVSHLLFSITIISKKTLQGLNLILFHMPTPTLEPKFINHFKTYFHFQHHFIEIIKTNTLYGPWPQVPITHLFK